ncbi:TonB-dependent receptor [Pedobacter cryophilus]|uniref:Energy transducer TonB n=1 Tax=Pedobacter cryophilus TaxID=2571271 RepID=A0A4U1C3M4_9SPHI|nr:TonB-dependent receptor [Pedobacter cryophilus]TKB97804.1 energy transducer TonB [Pedobacter cryophilus]
MKLSSIKVITLLFLFIASNQILRAQGNNIIVISGTIIDQDTKESIPGVSVAIKNTVSGTATNSEGKFDLRTKASFPLTLVVSSVGFKTQEFEVKGAGSTLKIALITQTQLGQEVVVTASRVEESILKSPVAIEKLDIRAIRESPAPSFYDALENVKGVQMTTSSLTFKVPNTRGFNIPNNFRFVQLVDGVDMQAGTLGVPLGNAIGPTELDISSVEITPGAASALYGMNAINGMANLLTKSPFYQQGLSLYQKTGLNHVGGGTGRDAIILTETAIRYAKAYNNKFAFKLNLSYMRGTDWVSDTRINQNPNSLNTANPKFSELNADADNPAYDAWNKYGDDGGSNAVTISGLTIPGRTGNQSVIIRRTGYYEKDIAQPTVDNLKFDGSLHYRLNDKAELSYGYRYGKLDGLFQRGNKIQMDNVSVQNHKLELKGANYFIRSYASIENTGDSYNLKPLVDNLDISSGGTNAVWGAKYKTAFQNAINGGTPLADALRIGRAAADASRVEPGTPAFNALKNTIININNWDHFNVVGGDAPVTGGAALTQKSRTYHTDAQVDLSKYTKSFGLLVGADARIYEVIPDGNNFVDFSRPNADRTKPLADGTFGDHVYYKKFGTFAQVTKTLFEEKLKLFGSLRLDYNPEFDPKLNPRIAAVYTLAEHHNFRASLQNGYRFPALFEALSFVNNGNIRRVGGLPYINEGLNYLDNSYTLTSINTFNAAVNTDVATGLSANAAALKNRALLETTSLSATQPERINSFEVGYKSILLENKLVLDIDAYSNEYSGFLGQVEVAVPYTSTTPRLTTQAPVGSDDAVIAALAANRNNQQTRYRVYTNAKNKYNNYGSSLGLTYNFYQKYTINGNVSYNNITENKQKDVFVTGFNTPNYTTNISFGNREIAKNVGFNVVWRWQESFLWESPLVNGQVPAYHTFDAQVTYRVPSAKANIKIGGTNIFNNKYLQYAGGPTLGALYYAAITFDGLLN